MLTCVCVVVVGEGCPSVVRSLARACWCVAERVCTHPRMSVRVSCCVCGRKR